MGELFVYVTASDREEALSIGRSLVEERLVACVNVFGPLTSVYWWQGEVQESAEACFVAKTMEHLFDTVVARVKELHSYEVPCVVAMPLAGGNTDFLDWIAAETGPKA